MYPDDPASGPAFPAEGNVDAQCAQERLRAPQAASECTGIFGPASALTQKVSKARLTEPIHLPPASHPLRKHSRPAYIPDYPTVSTVSIVCGRDRVWSHFPVAASSLNIAGSIWTSRPASS